MPHPAYYPSHWAFVARACAEIAYVKHRASARGVLLAEGEGVLVYYDNRLPGGSMLARERLARRFREHLAGVGIHALAAVTFPRSGPDDGRTLVVVLDAGPGEERAVTECWDRVCDEPPESSA